MIIYEYSHINAYATGNYKVISESDPIPTYWTDNVPPTTVDGEYARYDFPGWVVTDMPPPAIEEEIQPIAKQTPPTFY